MKKLNIAVTGINPTDNPGPGCGIIRSLRYNPDFRGKITGLAYDVMDPGNFLADHVDVSYLIPYPSQDIKLLLERISFIHRENPIDVIIPSLDAELLNFIKIQNELSALGIHTFLPTEEGFKMRSKNVLAEFCKANDISVPRTYCIYSIEDLYRVDFTYPFYMKGLFYDAYLVYSYAEACNIFNVLCARWGLPLIVQELIPGEEFDIVALGDGTGQTIGAVPMKKMSLTEKRKAWAGITVANDALIKMTQKIIKALRWRGPLEAEIMVNMETEKYYLIEINPRFPAWCFLAPGAGQNLPEALVSLALGEEVFPFETYQVGKLFVRYSCEVLADLKDMEQLMTIGKLEKARG